MSLLRFIVLAVLLVSSAAFPLRAQDDSKKPSAAAPAAQAATPPAAKPADVASPDAILAATYDVISGPAGPRDWDRFRSLFLPGARLAAVIPGKDGAGLSARSFTPEEYITFGDTYFQKNGF